MAFNLKRSASASKSSKGKARTVKAKGKAKRSLRSPRKAEAEAPPAPKVSEAESLRAQLAEAKAMLASLKGEPAQATAKPRAALTFGKPAAPVAEPKQERALRTPKAALRMKSQGSAGKKGWEPQSPVHAAWSYVSNPRSLAGLETTFEVKDADTDELLSYLEASLPKVPVLSVDNYAWGLVFMHRETRQQVLLLAAKGTPTLTVATSFGRDDSRMPQSFVDDVAMLCNLDAE